MMAGDPQSFDIIMINIGILRGTLGSHRKRVIIDSNISTDQSPLEDGRRNIQTTNMQQHITMASYIPQLESMYIYPDRSIQKAHNTTSTTTYSSMPRC